MNQPQEESNLPEHESGQGGVNMETIRLSTDIHLVPLQKVRLHERYDPKRVLALKEDILASNVLRNPPIAALAQGQYVVLDGATRTTALRQLGASHMAVQVVQYQPPQVNLDTWHHIVRDFSAAQMQEMVLAMSGIRAKRAALDDLQRDLAAGRLSVALFGQDGFGYAYERLQEEKALLTLLNQVVDTYIGSCFVERAKPEEAALAAERSHGICCIVAYPCFRPLQVLSMGLNGHKLPAGITRHIVRQRMINLMVPLPVLMDPERHTAAYQAISRRIGPQSQRQ